jgi:hypothetical protein
LAFPVNEKLDKKARSEQIYAVFSAAYPATADGQYHAHFEEDLKSALATNWRTRAALAEILQFPKDMHNFLRAVELQVFHHYSRAPVPVPAPCQHPFISRSCQHLYASAPCSTYWLPRPNFPLMQRHPHPPSPLHHYSSKRGNFILTVSIVLVHLSSQPVPSVMNVSGDVSPFTPDPDSHVQKHKKMTRMRYSSEENEAYVYSPFSINFINNNSTIIQTC